MYEMLVGNHVQAVMLTSMSFMSLFSGDGKVKIKTGQMPRITVREGDFKDVTC